MVTVYLTKKKLDNRLRKDVEKSRFNSFSGTDCDTKFFLAIYKKQSAESNVQKSLTY